MHCVVCCSSALLAWRAVCICLLIGLCACRGISFEICWPDATRVGLLLTAVWTRLVEEEEEKEKEGDIGYHWYMRHSWLPSCQSLWLCYSICRSGDQQPLCILHAVCCSVCCVLRAALYAVCCVLFCALFAACCPVCCALPCMLCAVLYALCRVLPCMLSAALNAVCCALPCDPVRCPLRCLFLGMHSA